MRRIKFEVYADKERIFEFDDNTTDQEIEQELGHWAAENTDESWKELEEQKQ